MASLFQKSSNHSASHASIQQSLALTNSLDSNTGGDKIDIATTVCSQRPTKTDRFPVPDKVVALEWEVFYWTRNEWKCGQLGHLAMKLKSYRICKKNKKFQTSSSTM
jgi:hypothetical protein